MPLALSAAATLWSIPAQPPSPDMMMAKESEGGVLGCGGTSTTGGSPNAAGGATTRLRPAAASLAKAALNGPSFTCGSVARAAQCTRATKSRLAAAGHSRPLASSRITQGLFSDLIGSRFNPEPRAPCVKLSPEPLHSALSRLKCGQKPTLSAPAKVSPGACASTA